MLKTQNYPLRGALLIAVIIMFSCQEKQKENIPEEPELTQEKTLKDIHLADPTIFLNDGTYYLYGTSQGIFLK